ncbi:MAG TPA: FAD-binding oxidoreductase [Anaerolineae bacterium]|nr:FAD-binding oxidoreductase [Anaerolineae bacterium]
MKTVPFWKDDVSRPAKLPSHVPPREVDVAIVGGGYTGLHAALRLAKQGISVAVLEQGQIGNGASAVNGGQVAPGLKLPIQKIFQKYGPELGRQLWDGSIAAVEHLEQTLTAEQIACDYTGGGGIALAYRPSHYDAMVKDAEWLARELDFQHVEVVPRERLREEVGSDVYYGGLIEPMGGGLHPAKYVYGLAQATARAGACLCEHTKALKISRSAGNAGFQVTTGRGAIKAGQVLMATNGYTDDLVKAIQRRIFTVGSYMITTAPLSPSMQRELSPKNRVMYDTKWFLNYFRLTPDGRMSMGGRNDLSSGLDLIESARNLGEAMVRIFPQLKGVPITHSWTGQLGLTFNVMPYIGQVDGIYHAFGYAGHGVALSGYLGKEVADLISGQSSASPFTRISPETSVFYHGRAWFLPVVASYYRFLDAVS